MSQEEFAEGLGLMFQQVQKYEKGANRKGASRLQHISHILRARSRFSLKGSPHGEAPSPAYVRDFPHLRQKSFPHSGSHFNGICRRNITAIDRH